LLQDLRQLGNVVRKQALSTLVKIGLAAHCKKAKQTNAPAIPAL
jgi:hypothetical protein